MGWFKLRVVCLAGLLCCAAGAQRPAPAPASAQSPALEADAARKLRARFDEADLDKNGRLTQDEARRAGFGFVAAHFGLIDIARRGDVSFEDVMRFMQHMRPAPPARRG